MATEASTHGQAADAGRPTIGTAMSDTSAAPSEIATVVASGSSPRLMLAFQPAWQAAANSTAAKTRESMLRRNHGERLAIADRMQSLVSRHIDHTKQFRKLSEALKVDTCDELERTAVDRQNRRLGLAKVGIRPTKWRHILQSGKSDHHQLLRDNQTSTPPASSGSLRNVDSFDFLRGQTSILDRVADDQSSRTSDPETVTIDLAIMRMTGSLRNRERPIRKILD